MEFVSRAAAEGSGGDRRWPCKVRVKSCSRYMAELIIHYGRGSCINAVLGKIHGRAIYLYTRYGCRVCSWEIFRYRRK